jgi:hypothetical protein
MKHRPVFAALVVVLAASAAVAAPPGDKPPVAPTPKSAPIAAVQRSDVTITLEDTETKLFIGKNLAAGVVITLPKGKAQCQPKIACEINGNTIGEATIGTTGAIKTSADGNSTIYERVAALPVEWVPPQWKAGTYQLSVRMTDGDGCRTLQVIPKATLTVKPATTDLKINAPASMTKGQPVTVTVNVNRMVGSTATPLAGEPLTGSVCGSAFPPVVTNSQGIATFTKVVPATCPNPGTLGFRHVANDVQDHIYEEVKVPTK